MMRSSNFFVQTLSSVSVFLTLLASAHIYPAQAISLVTGRSALAANDQIDWSTLGPTQPFNILPNTFSSTSSGGIGLTVAIPPTSVRGVTPPLVFQTAPPPTGIPTNFADGDYVLLTGLTPGVFPSPGNPGPLSITFNTPIFGSGAQIAVDDVTSFTASVSAYDNQNQLLGTFSESGTSSLALDNSAIFLGVSSDTPNISRLEFSSSVPDRAFGLNTLSLKTEPVPEPNMDLVPVIAGIGLFVLKKTTMRKRKYLRDAY